MFTKINNKLLTRYPLLWNTRIVNVLVAAIATHLLFYAAGLLQRVEVDELWNYRLFNMEGTGLFSGLVTAIFIIVWLVYYFRNNAFKSFYIIPRNYLFYEFLLVFLVFLSTASFYLTYNQGIYDTVRFKTSGTNLVKEANTINLASHFIAFEHSYFNPSYNCEEGNSQSSQENTYFPDSQKRRLSYLNYCHQQVEFDNDPPVLSAKQVHDIGNRWLLRNNRDSVRMVLKEFLGLCEKYGVRYQLNINAQVDEVFSDEDHTVNSFVGTYGGNGEYGNTVFINVYELTSAIRQVKRAHEGFWKKDMVFFILYYAFCAALLVFSFRLTRTKPWFIAVISLGVLAIIVSLIAVMVHAGRSFPLFPLLLWALFIFLTLYWVFNKENKLFAGVSFNLVIWFAPAVIPIVCVLIYQGTGYDYSQDYNVYDESSIHEWIRENWATINTINLLALAAAVYLAFIPLARKWQSNPEE